MSGRLGCHVTHTGQGDGDLAQPRAQRCIAELLFSDSRRTEYIERVKVDLERSIVSAMIDRH